MAYGDSGNWDGKVPAAANLMNIPYNLDLLATWRRNSGLPRSETVTIKLYGGEEAKDVARSITQAWITQNPHAVDMVYDEPVHEKQVRFERAPRRMEVRCYPENQAAPAYTEVLYGVKTPLFPAAPDPLSIFKT